MTARNAKGQFTRRRRNPGKAARAYRRSERHRRREAFGSAYERGWTQGMRYTAAGRAELKRLARKRR